MKILGINFFWGFELPTDMKAEKEAQQAKADAAEFAAGKRWTGALTPSRVRIVCDELERERKREVEEKRRAQAQSASQAARTTVPAPCNDGKMPVFAPKPIVFTWKTPPVTESPQPKPVRLATKPTRASGSPTHDKIPRLILRATLDQPYVPSVSTPKACPLPGGGFDFSPGYLPSPYGFSDKYLCNVLNAGASAGVGLMFGSILGPYAVIAGLGFNAMPLFDCAGPQMLPCGGLPSFPF